MQMRDCAFSFQDNWDQEKAIWCSSCVLWRTVNHVTHFLQLHLLTDLTIPVMRNWDLKHINIMFCIERLIKNTFQSLRNHGTPMMHCRWCYWFSLHFIHTPSWKKFFLNESEFKCHNAEQLHEEEVQYKTYMLKNTSCFNSLSMWNQIFLSFFCSVPNSWHQHQCLWPTVFCLLRRILSIQSIFLVIYFVLWM